MWFSGRLNKVNDRPRLGHWPGRLGGTRLQRPPGVSEGRRAAATRRAPRVTSWQQAGSRGARGPRVTSWRQADSHLHCCLRVGLLFGVLFSAFFSPLLRLARLLHLRHVRRRGRRRRALLGGPADLDPPADGGRPRACLAGPRSGPPDGVGRRPVGLGVAVRRLPPRYAIVHRGIPTGRRVGLSFCHRVTLDALLPLLVLLLFPRYRGHHRAHLHAHLLGSPGRRHRQLGLGIDIIRNRSVLYLWPRPRRSSRSHAPPPRSPPQRWSPHCRAAHLGRRIPLFSTTLRISIWSRRSSSGTFGTSSTSICQNCSPSLGAWMLSSRAAATQNAPAASWWSTSHSGPSATQSSRPFFPCATPQRRLTSPPTCVLLTMRVGTSRVLRGRRTTWRSAARQPTARPLTGAGSTMTYTARPSRAGLGLPLGADTAWRRPMPVLTAPMPQQGARPAAQPTFTLPGPQPPQHPHSVSRQGGLKHRRRLRFAGCTIS